jgi:arabinofuranosyltransferase
MAHLEPAAIGRHRTGAVPEAFHGIVDERDFYYHYTGLIAVAWQGHYLLTHPWASSGIVRHGKPSVIANGAVGLLGYYAGPTVHIIDSYALADPLLARLPAVPQWRIGHFQRLLPDGYQEGLEACVQRAFPNGATRPTRANCLDWPDTNRIADPVVARKYDLIRTVTQGPLFSAERIRAIMRLNLGG